VVIFNIRARGVEYALEGCPVVVGLWHRHPSNSRLSKAASRKVQLAVQGNHMMVAVRGLVSDFHTTEGQLQQQTCSGEEGLTALSACVNGGEQPTLALKSVHAIMCPKSWAQDVPVPAIVVGKEVAANDWFVQDFGVQEELVGIFIRELIR
jgi:hypothetical protein